MIKHIIIKYMIDQKNMKHAWIGHSIFKWYVTYIFYIYCYYKIFEVLLEVKPSCLITLFVVNKPLVFNYAVIETFFQIQIKNKGVHFLIILI